MAQVREYAYTVVGNILRLVEKDVNFDNDPTSKNYGPGVDRGEWKSPLATVGDGLQLQYTYAPTYANTSTSTINSDYFRFLGWGSDGTNLLLFTGATAIASVYNLTSKFSAGDKVQWAIYNNCGANIEPYKQATYDTKYNMFTGHLVTLT